MHKCLNYTTWDKVNKLSVEMNEQKRWMHCYPPYRERYYMQKKQRYKQTHRTKERLHKSKIQSWSAKGEKRKKKSWEREREKDYRVLKESACIPLIHPLNRSYSFMVYASWWHTHTHIQAALQIGDGKVVLLKKIVQKLYSNDKKKTPTHCERILS